MKFYLKVFDNNHHWDESSAYKHGSFETYEEAVNGAKTIIREFLSGESRFGSKVDDLMGSYIMYGEEPVIFPNEPTDGKIFSPRAFAEAYANEICKYT